MAQPLWTLLSVNLRGWISARGFTMAVAAALVPMVLTGAWIATHQADLSVESVGLEPASVVEGDNVTFLATVRNAGSGGVGRFNASVNVGQVFGNTLRAEATNTTVVESLGAGQSATARLTWTARPGLFWVLGAADPDDDVGELEEFNNQKPVPFLVRYKVPAADAAPRATLNLSGNESAATRVQAAVTSLAWSPEAPKPGDQVSFTAVVANTGSEPIANASLALRVGRAFGTSFIPQRDTPSTVDLAPGATETLELTWTAQEGAYWVEAYVSVPDAVHDPDASDNRVARPVVVQPVMPADLTPPSPPDKVTIKDFYLQILSLLHLRLLIPLIGLFYAAGVLADEREAGTLGYILTRPVERWSIPVAKFLAGYAVAAVAVVVGIVGTFLLLFGGAAQGDLGFLTTPLLASLVALFVYGTFFVLLGVVLDRPYLVGIAFVIGWENIASLFVPWVENLTLSHYITEAIRNWPLAEGFQPLPTGASVQALLLVLVAGAAFLAGAAMLMKRREFDV